jgi:Fe2+ transport system protein FeoA
MKSVSGEPETGANAVIQRSYGVFRPRRFFPTRVARHPACADCPLNACSAGWRATVRSISCPAHDAERLRTLGVYEGAEVGVLDTRSGVVLDVRGSRLALGWELAAAILVGPLTA